MTNRILRIIALVVALAAVTACMCSCFVLAAAVSAIDPEVSTEVITEEYVPEEPQSVIPDSNADADAPEYCTLAALLNDPDMPGAVDADTVCFYANAYDGYDAEQIKKSALKDYTYSYDYICSDWFYSHLSGDGLVVYKAFKYALEYERHAFVICTRDTDFQAISGAISYLTADDPFFEGNYETDVKCVQSREIDGTMYYYYSVSTTALSESYYDDKLIALEKAKSIVSQMPGYESERDKAYYLYSWIVENVSYSSNESYNESHQNYVYDALVLGVTNCDGYANSLALLLNLAGIDCMVSLGDAGGGHAWNACKIDGEYYQMDATFDWTFYDIPSMSGRYVYFLQSDDVMMSVERTYDADIADEMPVCDSQTYDYRECDARLDDISDRSGVKEAAKLLKTAVENREAFVLALPELRKTDGEEADALLDKMLDTANVNRSVTSYFLNDIGVLVVWCE